MVKKNVFDKPSIEYIFHINGVVAWKVIFGWTGIGIGSKQLFKIYLQLCSR